MFLLDFELAIMAIYVDMEEMWIFPTLESLQICLRQEAMVAIEVEDRRQ